MLLSLCTRRNSRGHWISFAHDIAFINKLAAHVARMAKITSALVQASLGSSSRKEVFAHRCFMMLRSIVCDVTETRLWLLHRQEEGRWSGVKNSRSWGTPSDSSYDIPQFAAQLCSLLTHFKPEYRLNNTQAKKFRSVLIENGTCPLPRTTYWCVTQRNYRKTWDWKRSVCKTRVSSTESWVGCLDRGGSTGDRT